MADVSPLTVPVPDPDRCRLFGLAVDPLTMDQVLSRCAEAVRSRTPLTIGVVNAAKVIRLRSDAVLRDSLVDCDVLLADGQSVVWAGQILGQPLPERVAGIDLFERLLDVADREARAVYLLGATPDVLASLLEQVEVRWPRLRVAGSRDGYFSEDEEAEVARDIARSGADMLFLGMTSPKKEIFLGRYGDRLNVPVRHGVGGSFDVLAGVTKRAPLIWQRFGMEWAYRLLQEPRRMWRRYLTGNTAFVALVVRERIHRAPMYSPRSAPLDGVSYG